MSIEVLSFVLCSDGVWIHEASLFHPFKPVPSTKIGGKKLEKI
jgi:hypothetical protein